MEGQGNEVAAEAFASFPQGTDWITDFCTWTDGLASPLLFRRWTAISVLANAMQRNLWVVTNNSPLYPHLYIILVAPPGIGKTITFPKARELLATLAPNVHMSSSSITAASLVDELAEANCRIVRMNEVPAAVAYNSLSIISNELGVLLPEYDRSFMNTLQDLYDSLAFSQRRRTRDLKIIIKHPQINILAGCTPAYLQNTLPEGAWAEGFTARCIFISASDQIIASLFREEYSNEKLQASLSERLKRINELYGRMSFTPEARRFIDHWHMSGREPVPDHPKLFHYNTRRTVHVLKLAMIACISEGAGTTITEFHLQRALDWLIEAEHYIPEIFKSMDNTSHSQILKDTWHYVFETWKRENKRPVSEARIVNFISKRVPAAYVYKVLEVMEKSGYLRRTLGAGGNEYVPAEGMNK